jgi:nucleobindin
VTEQFHSTPETQTDESYNHPEDIEHFSHHEAIEREEARREAQFQGITVDEALAQHDPDAEPKKPKVTRVTPPEKLDPEVRYGGAKEESKDRPEWGSGNEGFKAPKTPVERLRKNVPYKVNRLLACPKIFLYANR